MLAAILAGLSLGAAPATWVHPEARGTDDGAESVSLAENGWILLAPSAKEILPGDQKIPSPPFLWSCAVDLKGSLLAGGGSDAVVLRLDRKGKPEPVFDNQALGVRALATSVAGDVFVGTFPSGRVYRVNASGKTEVYFEPEERYIWAMATDAFDRLYVATGERGLIYEVTGRGEGRVFFDSDEPHISALAADPSGRILAGSVGRGLLYRLDSRGHAEVILDSSLVEISAIVAASDGTVYAAAINPPAPRRPRRPGDTTDQMTIDIAPSSGDGVLEEATEGRRKLTIDLGELVPPAAEGSAVPPLSRVYRIVPGHTPDALWTSSTEQAYSLALDAHGHLLIGTGPFGRIYRMEPDGAATELRRFPVSQITALVGAPEGRTYALTSNPGRIEMIESALESTGRYLSPVRDAGVVSSWGSARWDADTPPGTKIDIVARSGNSAVPDDTWSTWSDPLREPRGSPLRIAAGRYIQWRADLTKLKTEATPILKSVSLTWLPENIAPTIRRVALGPPAAARPKDEPRAASLWVSWLSADANGDPLRHTVSVKRADESEWKTLGRDVKESPFEIDPTKLAEGRYVARVVVDDGETNGAERALTGEAKSDAFDVDRTAPVITPAAPEESAGQVTVRFSVRDALSLVARAEWAADESGPWVALTPADGIADTPEEDFVVRPSPSDARRRIFLRAADAAGNVSTLEVNLTRPR